MITKEYSVLSWRERLRLWLWPRAGWKRVLQHIWNRIRRLKDTPHAIAAGFTSGIIVSFTPLIGLHVLLACLLAWMLRGNIIAALLGTLAGNPITFPAIWTLIYQIGARMSGTQATAEFNTQTVPTIDVFFEESSWNFVDAVATMALGSVPVCLLLAILIYPTTRWSVGIYQHKRQQQRERRRARANS